MQNLTNLTEEEQSIVNEAKANGTFDASNPDIRYSLASDMARDAVMTALEGAGIDVEMATPEMVEDVLRARDAEFMSFATSAEEFRNRAKLAKENVGIVAKGLNEINVKIEKVPRHRFKGSGKEAIEKARNWANNNLIGEHTYHKGKVDEFKYQIEPEAVDKFLSSSSTTNSENLGVHLATLTKLVDVIDNSVDAEIHPNYKKINKVRSPKNGIKDDNMLVHRLYGAIEIDNRIYRVKTTIYEVWNDKNKVHDYRITKVELAESVPSTGNAPTNPTFVSGAKLLKNVEKSYDKGKKLLEESEWNPQFHIAYHGSGAKFDEFDHSHMGEGEGRKISRSKGITEDLPYKDGVKNFDEDDKKTSISERSGAVSGNSSSDGLLEKSNEHLSRYPLTTNQDTAKLQQNSQAAIASAQKVINKGGFDKAINSPNDAVRELGKALKMEKSLLFARILGLKAKK